MNRENKLVY